MSGQFLLWQGWISISISPDADADCFDALKKAIHELEVFMRPQQMVNQLFEIKPFNLEQVLFIAGSHNHDVGYSDSIVEVLNKVAELAPASHGLVYIRWPEHPTLWNQYKVYKMARGKITMEDDPFFSPCNPLIED